MTRTAYLYVTHTMADWETGYAIAELNSGRYFKDHGERIPVVAVGATRAPIVTLGGVTIAPQATVDEVTPDNTAVLILPGADNWQDAIQSAIIAKVKELLRAGSTVASICGSTGALAAAGLPDDRPHTSNALEYLRMVAPNYKGERFYQTQNTVGDGNLITASSAGALPFARLILERLDVMSPEALAAWYDYFRTGEARYFSALMQSLPEQQHATAGA